MIIVFAYVVGCRVAVAQQRGLERPANALQASSGHSCRMTTTVSIYCPLEGRRLCKKLITSLGLGRGALQRRILKRALYNQKWFQQLPDCRFQMLRPETRSTARQAGRLLQIDSTWPEMVSLSPRPDRALAPPAAVCGTESSVARRRACGSGSPSPPYFDAFALLDSPCPQISFTPTT